MKRIEKDRRNKMKVEDIILAAEEAGLPRGWYQYEDGIPDCLQEFVDLIITMSKMNDIISKPNKNREINGK